jgi:serine/threonine protein kinase
MKRKATSKTQIATDLSGYAQILSVIGQETSKEIKLLTDTVSDMELRQGELLQMLADTIKTGWADSDAAAIIHAIRDRLKVAASLDTIALRRWIQIHQGDSSSVIDCMSVDPPERVTILKVMSRAGSQKLVFLASWQIAQREIVLKRFRNPDANRIFQRETQTHPLSMTHPNIIETFSLQNRNGEYFLVERCLPVVLSDDWISPGLHETANLLRDITSAVAFLSDQQLIHADIKPDNIGFENSRYILLDFGLCRLEDAFSLETSPTGSLCTRAPELLMGGSPQTKSSDIWSLGATVFNSLVHRFPLFEKGETPPRASDPEHRKAFEEDMRHRVQDEWDKRVDCSLVPPQLQHLLGQMLKREPESRIKAHELLKQTESELSAMLRFREEGTNISPSEEIRQLAKFLPGQEVLCLLPVAQRRELETRVKSLNQKRGLTPEEVRKLKGIISCLPAEEHG